MNWDRDTDETRRIGARFIAEGIFALMNVPSVIMPKARNFLLNPAHVDAGQIRIVETYRYPFDSRLIK